MPGRPMSRMIASNGPDVAASIAAGLWDRARHGAGGRWAKAEGTR